MFNNIVDTGAFMKVGLVLMAVGAVAFLRSFLLPGQMDGHYWG